MMSKYEIGTEWANRDGERTIIVSHNKDYEKSTHDFTACRHNPIDDSYDISINLNNPKASLNQFKNVIRYDFKKAKFQSISYSNSIGQNKTANLNFICKCNVSAIDKAIIGKIVSLLPNDRACPPLIRLIT